MARIRTVKPELFRHEDLFELEQTSRLPVRLSFIALFTACDREGRFKWRSRQLKLDCLPYDEVDFSRVLDALATGGFVVKYSVLGVDYGVIPSFKSHQIINNRESESVLPSPPELLGEKLIKPENLAPLEPLIDDKPRVDDACGTPLNLDQGEREGKGREKEGEKEGEKNTPNHNAEKFDEDKIPQTTGEWMEFFVNQHGFQFHEVQTAKTIPMYADWVKREISIGIVESAINATASWLERRGEKGKPDNPGIYEKFVNTIINEQSRLELKNERSPTRNQKPKVDSVFSEKYAGIGSIP